MNNAIFALDELRAAQAAAVEQTCCTMTHGFDEDGNEVANVEGWLC